MRFVLFCLSVERVKRHSSGGSEKLYDVAERLNSIFRCTFSDG